MKRFLAGLSWGLALLVPAAAASTSPSTGTGSSAGSAVRVMAVVTNARGEPVAGLRAADFELTVDGQPQAVDELEFRTGAAGAPRVLALLLDEFHVAAESSGAVRDALLLFVDSHLRGGDRTIVFKPLDSLRLIEPTANAQAVRDAIATFEGRKGDYAPRTEFERRYMAQAPNAVVTARAQIVSSALRTLAARLGELRQARPAIVLVSEGFERQRSERSLPANLLSAVRIANRGDVPVYVFSPSAGVTSLIQDGETVDGAEAALRQIAAQTGGDFTSGVASFTGGLARMIRDLEAHYVLTYRPAHGDDGRFHTVAVGLKRRDARVRARAGYVAAVSPDLRARSAPTSAPVRVLRRSGLIQTWSGITHAGSGSTRVVFTWEPTAVPPGATRREPALVAVTASTPGRGVLFDGNLAAVGARASAGGSNRAEFEAPPGRVLIDVKILDAKGVVLDTDARDLDVPDLRTMRAAILPPAVLRSASAREFRAISENPDAAPVASREFRRTERLLLRVPAYEAGGVPARVSATLLNRWRQPMRALPAMAGPLRDGVTQFDVPLAPLAPGEYTIRLSAGSLIEHVTFRVRG